MKLQIAVLVAVLVCLIGVEAQRRRGRPGGRRGRRPSGDQFSYSVDLGDGVVVKQGAFSPDDRDVVFVKSFDRALREQNFTRAGTFYDFSGANPIFTILRGKGPCLVGDTTLTYANVISDLTARNGTTVTITQEVALDGTGEPMPEADTTTLFEDNPALRFACGFRSVVRLTAATAGAADASTTTEIKVLTLDSIVTVTVPTPPETSERPERPGRLGGRGRPGGRRGGRPGARRGGREGSGGQ